MSGSLTCLARCRERVTFFGPVLFFELIVLDCYIYFVFGRIGVGRRAEHRHFVLAGVCAFERATHWIEQKLNAIAERFDPLDGQPVEFYGSPMLSGREGWNASC